MIQPTYPELHDPGLRKFVYRRALETYGKFNQLIVANEELGELSKEICKYLRGIGNRENLVEEIADVRIMIEQLEMLFDCHEDVETMMQGKAERLTRKLDRDEKEKGLCLDCEFRGQCAFPALHPSIRLKTCEDYRRENGQTDT